MIAQVAWLEREFVFSQPIGLFPIVLERLRGTPARAKELVSGIRKDTLARRVHAKWSVKDHLGHLIDLEPLDDRRLDEFLNHAEVLSAADIENSATENGNHRRVPIADLIQRLAAGRARLLLRLKGSLKTKWRSRPDIPGSKNSCACWTVRTFWPSPTIIIWRLRVAS